jgi:hypothetical protein
MASGDPAAITNHFNALVREHWDDDFADNVFYGNPTLDYFWENRTDQKGGQGVEWRFFDEAGSYGFTYIPYGIFPVKPARFAKAAYLEWCHLVKPLVISSIQVDMAKDEDDVFDLIEEQISHAKKSFRKMLSELIYELHGSDPFQHPDFPDELINPFPGLPTIVGTSRNYAGINSTTYTALNAYVRELAADVAFSDLYLMSDVDYLPAVLTECMNETDFDDGDNVDYVTGHPLMEEALALCAVRNDTRVRTSEKKQEIKISTYFDGIPVGKDKSAGTGTMYGLNSEHIYIKTLRNVEMKFTPFQPNVQGDGMVGNYKLSCLIKCNEPRRSWKIEDGPAARS